MWAAPAPGADASLQRRRLAGTELDLNRGHPAAACVHLTAIRDSSLVCFGIRGGGAPASDWPARGRALRAPLRGFSRPIRDSGEKVPTITAPTADRQSPHVASPPSQISRSSWGRCRPGLPDGLGRADLDVHLDVQGGRRSAAARGARDMETRHEKRTPSISRDARRKKRSGPES